MADEDREQQALQARGEGAPDGGEEEDDDVASPFDHPAFLPVLLWALALWFGYDGWLNPDFQPGGESHEHVAFNQGGFALLVLGAIYYTVRELRVSRAREYGGSDTTRSGGE